MAALDTAKGLSRAGALQVGPRRHAGSFQLGASVDRTHAVANAELLYRFTDNKHTNISAFANGFAGMTRSGNHWDRNYGAAAGLKITW